MVQSKGLDFAEGVLAPDASTRPMDMVQLKRLDFAEASSPRTRRPAHGMVLRILRGTIRRETVRSRHPASATAPMIPR